MACRLLGMNTQKSRAQAPTREQYWSELLSKCDASGMSQLAFARAHKVAPSSLSKWRTALRKQASSQIQKSPVAGSSPRLLRVDVLQAPTAMCEIVLSVGTFRFAPTIPAEQLRALLSVLTKASCQ